MRFLRALWATLATQVAFSTPLISPYFEPNRGQVDSSTAFLARGSGYAVLLQHDGRAVYTLAEPVSVSFPGRRTAAAIRGERLLPGITSYYRGCSTFISAIPHFDRVRYGNIYPGIDLVWRSQGADLEYEFTAQAGADPERIRIRFTGAKRVSTDEQGNLILETSSGKIEHHRPIAWQEIAGGRREVRICLRLRGFTAHFEVGPYDHSRPLRIDPVLTYATYLGGAGFDAGYAIATDTSGGVYVTGTTSSIGFPAQGSTINSNTEAFVMRFDESGTLLYNTILASNGGTSGQAIAVDPAGNAYVAGTTQATNFPVMQTAWQKVFGGVADVFAVKLNSAGQLVYATYIGGMGQETGTGIAIDSAGSAYVSGYTTGSFPTTLGAAQKLYGGGFADAFLVKLNSGGSNAAYATLLGGTGNDLADGVIVDASGRACIAGYTDSTNLAVHAALQPMYGGQGDGLIACLSIDGAAWTMVSYLGGSNLDQILALTIDPAGCLFVVGSTFSEDFPVTAGVVQTVNAGGYDAFVTKLGPGGANWVFSTLLGGSASDAALAVAVDDAGNIWTGGYTLSTNFPLSKTLQSAGGGSFDGFIAALSADGTTLQVSTYLGGAADDRVFGIALDTGGLVFATGWTLSKNFPVSMDAMQGAAPAGVNAFVANINPPANSISGLVTVGGNTMDGVTMTLSGSQNNSSVTNARGYYRFTVPPGGSYVVTPSLNGYVFGPGSQSYTNLNSNQTANFSASLMFTISGQVSIWGSGLSGVSMKLSGPQDGAGTTDATGRYSFTVQKGGTYTVTPSLSGFAFDPLSANFANLTTNQRADFTGQCGVSVSPSPIFLDASSQTGPALNVSAGSTCPWSGLGNGFLSIIQGGNGSGNGTVMFSAAANSSGATRTGGITVGGQTVTVTQRATSDIFADIAPADYYFDFADTMYQQKITAGCSTQPLDYCPGATTTRAQMAVFLIAAIEGGNSFTYTATPYFSDVPASSPVFRFVQKLKDLGITGGCSTTQFCPDDPVTRGQMAVFIIASRYGTTGYNYPSTAYFTDVPSGSLFFPFVQKMAQAGITAGCGTGLYCPNQTLTRGQMAVFIVTGLLNELLPAGTPAISSAAPNAVDPGQTVTVTLTGVNTHFSQGVTQVAVPAGVTVSNLTVFSATSLRVQLAAGAGVVPNPKTIVVTTGTEEAVLANGFWIQ